MSFVTAPRPHPRRRNTPARFRGRAVRSGADGQRIHFLHVRSRCSDALPLILTHGWPGSVAEFLAVIGPRQQPQSLAFALNDSPVGLLGWHCVVYRGDLDADYILTNVMIHWLTGTVASAMRLYREDTLTPRHTTATTAPIGVAQFAQDYEPIERLVSREHSTIVSRHVYDQPGHFSAHQSPDLLVADLGEFFVGLRGYRRGN